MPVPATELAADAIGVALGVVHGVLEKGAEMGRFLLGSTVVMLFPKDVLRFGSDWAPGGSVRMGEPMARAKSSAPSDGAPAPGDAP